MNLLYLLVSFALRLVHQSTPFCLCYINSDFSSRNSNLRYLYWFFYSWKGAHILYISLISTSRIDNVSTTSRCNLMTEISDFYRNRNGYRQLRKHKTNASLIHWTDFVSLHVTETRTSSFQFNFSSVDA